MLYSPAFSFSSGYPLGVLPCAGLRLGVLRQFQAFLASSACAACASSYHFSSIASPPWRSAFSRFAPVVNLGFPVLASGSNCAVKPTRLRRAAYFRSLGEMKWVNGLNISKTFQKKTQQTTMSEEGTVRPTRQRVISLLSLVVYKPPIKRELPS